MIGVSDKQREMLAFIENFVTEKGYPPTLEEIRTGLDISTKSLVNYHLEALETAGLLSRSPNTPRGIRLNNENETFRVPFAYRPVDNRPGMAANIDEQDAIELTCDITPNDHDLYALKVEGEAFLDALVNDGDIVIMQQQNQAHNGEMVAVRLLEQGQTTLKRFYRENGHVRLEPANPSLEPIIVSPDAVEIQGKVMAIIRRVI